MTFHDLKSRYPLALRKGDVLDILKTCGLGSEAKYDSLLQSGRLIPLRNLPGAKQARFSREQVLGLVAEALNLEPQA